MGENDETEVGVIIPGSDVECNGVTEIPVYMIKNAKHKPSVTIEVD